MFDNIKDILDKYEKMYKRINDNCNYELTKDDKDLIDYFDLYLAKAIMIDNQYYDKGEKIAKIILATLGLSNEIKIKVE